jgi:hypothetical protein
MVLIETHVVGDVVEPDILRHPFEQVGARLPRVPILGDEMPKVAQLGSPEGIACGNS